MSVPSVACRVVCAALLCLAVAAPSATADVRKHFLTFNACGAIHQDDNWRCGSEDDTGRDDNNWGRTGDDSVVEAIRRSIYNHDPKPDAVMLQEMCATQFDALRERVQSGGYHMDGRFEATGWNIESSSHDRPNCNGTDKRHGLGILVRGDIDWGVTDVLKFVHQADSSSGDGNQDRKMLCVKVKWANPTRICNTHLATGSADDSGDTCGDRSCRWNQALEIENFVARQYLDPYGTPVVIGGDFNAQPNWSTLDHLYAPWINPENSGHGRFKEVDQNLDGLRGDANNPDPGCRCGENTFAGSDGSRKLDYIFVSQGHFYDVHGDATWSDWSDHDPLWGDAMLRTP